jgi:hypothetical protein
MMIEGSGQDIEPDPDPYLIRIRIREAKKHVDPDLDAEH